MSASPPTRLRGVVDDLMYDSVLADMLEYVPDLTWPLSVGTYAQMRRDPQLAAVLAAYTLLIRRASWTVDGTGCRPEVAQLVADDLGLPVAGQDRPGASRARGVSWPEHLRAALLSLTYGHMGFAMKADLSSGQARLVTLAERMPHTIAEIHVDPSSGDFLGITQQVTAQRIDGSPEIRADQMVWYANDREGASWQGTSLLRPAYAPWLLKRETQRVAATGIRRFSMGVPTIEWAAGTNPTPTQISEAQLAASAARVGDQSGMSLPPGARLVLAGLTGSTPDALAFIKWLDSQMSGMALARFMDLGDTAHGSRALGEAFIDLFTLSVQACADSVGDTATRQVAARLVEWNWGADEPVPRVAVAEVGAREDITADAVKALVDAGALSADPGLEAHLRRRYRLPEREAPQLPPAPPPPAPVTASPRARARRKAPPSTQLALPIAAAAGDPGDVQAQWLRAHADLMAQWPVLAEPMVDDLAATASAATEDGDLAALGTMTVSAAVIGAVAAALTTAAADLAVTAAAGLVADAATAGITIPTPTNVAARAEQTATAIAGILASGYASGAARAALLTAGEDTAPDVIADAVRAHLTELGATPTGWVADNLGAAMTTAQHSGRTAVMAAHPAATYRADETLDTNTCGPCSDRHGTEYPTLTAALADYPTGGLRDCDGGLRCRGLIIPIWN